MSNDICYIDGKAYSLLEVEKMGIDNFSINAHVSPYKSLFKYYPNTTKCMPEKKEEINHSFEALENNKVFLQEAKHFDDCFDCVVDLDCSKFVFERLKGYCDYFHVDIKSDSIDDIVFALSLKLYELGTIKKSLENISSISDEVQRLQLEVFIREVFIKVSSGDQWQPAIFDTIKKEYEKFRKVLSKFKISCFSTSPYLNRMWGSAYADNNRGFCVEYEIDLSSKEGVELYNNIFPVIYAQKRNDLSSLSANCDKSFTKEDLWQIYFNGLLRKSLHWIDQCEWRLIMCDGFIKENPMPFFKIKKVYLGNKMSLEERMKIVGYCRDHAIEYVGMIRENNSFNLVECRKDCFVCIKEKNKNIQSK